MDEVCITFSESDVVIFPIELLCRPLVQVVDIGERPIPYFLDVAVLDLTHLPGEMRSAEDRPDLTWGFHFWSVILQSCPSVINIILEVPTMDELLYLIFEGDALLSGVIDVFMVFWFLLEQSPRNGSSHLNTPVSSGAM